MPDDPTRLYYTRRLALTDRVGVSAGQAGRRTHAPCPVILLTGQGNEQLAVQALHAGAQDYVVKHDLSAALLYQTITQAMETFRQRQAQRRSGTRCASRI